MTKKMPRRSSKSNLARGHLKWLLLLGWAIVIPPLATEAFPRDNSGPPAPDPPARLVNPISQVEITMERGFPHHGDFDPDSPDEEADIEVNKVAALSAVTPQKRQEAGLPEASERESRISTASPRRLPHSSRGHGGQREQEVTTPDTSIVVQSTTSPEEFASPPALEDKKTDDENEENLGSGKEQFDVDEGEFSENDPDFDWRTGTNNTVLDPESLESKVVATTTFEPIGKLALSDNYMHLIAQLGLTGPDVSLEQASSRRHSYWSAWRRSRRCT